MSYLFIILDLIAGLLVGVHLWVPEKHRKNWDRWLLGNLSPTSNPVDEKTVRVSIVGTTLVVVGIMVWGYYVDINLGSFTAQELLHTSLLVVTGIPMAVILLIAVMMLYQRITIIHNLPLVGVIAILGLVGSFTLLLLNFTNHVVDRIIIGFVFSLAFMTLLIQLLPLARKFLTFESGVLARLGVTIFLINRCIQIANVQ